MNTEHARAKDKNNTFDKVFIGKQIAIDINGNGFVDSEEIFTNDMGIKEDFDRFF